MADSPDPSTEFVTEFGITAHHPPSPEEARPVAPSSGKEFNVLKADLRSIACLSLTDLGFEFDSSFVMPGAA